MSEKLTFSQVLDNQSDTMKLWIYLMMDGLRWHTCSLNKAIHEVKKASCFSEEEKDILERLFTAASVRKEIK